MTMKIAVKWFLWYLCISVYVMFLGGIFYYNLFKWTFDEKLKQQSIDLVKVHAFQLIKGLSKSQVSISMDEYDVVNNALAKDERVASLLYLNRYGEVRWFKDPAMIGLTMLIFMEKMLPAGWRLAQLTGGLKIVTLSTFCLCETTRIAPRNKITEGISCTGRGTGSPKCIIPASKEVLSILRQQLLHIDINNRNICLCKC
jgi:hypothetical protein